ncbi:MAG: hypothetical protein U1E19_03130 [Rhodoblastus sp.]
MRFLALMGLATVLGVASAQAADVSRYTSVNDRKACAYTHNKASNDGPESCEFACKGPVAGVSTKLLSCYDYEHLYVKLDGKSFSTWGAMIAVGGFSGLANKNGMVEWVFAEGKEPSRASLKGLIVRFQGTDAETNKNRNALAVMSLKAGQICWKGNYPTNEAARAAIDGAACQSPLTEEGK